ncbi:MAG: hypothetical protein Ta2E_06660 [Mycoplasmoidaceae bacterium]|nr:MAG: hypothetical protein Ta2E_06660 [Mycoplasmoidaceae bacterium]
MQIYIALPDHPIFALEVETADSVNSVKSKINDRINVSVEKLKLRYLGTLLENDKTLDYYNVQRDATLDLITTRQILVYSAEKFPSFSFELEPTDTINDAMNIIYDKTQVLIEKQNLTYNTVKLEKEKQISEYGIIDKSVFFLREKTSTNTLASWVIPVAACGGGILLLLSLFLIIKKKKHKR